MPPRGSRLTRAGDSRCGLHAAFSGGDTTGVVLGCAGRRPLSHKRLLVIHVSHCARQYEPIVCYFWGILSDDSEKTI
eukprot:790280-Amphidinium_carterae.1